MSLRQCTPCDYGECPYNAMYNHDCEYWCGADEPEDVEVWLMEDEDEEVDEPDYEEELEDYEGDIPSYTIYDLDMGFDPYMGCYSDDC